MPTLFRDKVTFGDIVFNDPLQRPLPAGIVEWGCDVLAGWDESFDIADVFVSKGSVDGAVSGEFFPANARQMMVGGYVVASTRAIADQLWDIIVREAFPRNVRFDIVRYETTPKLLTVKLSGRRTIEWVGPLAFRWGAEVTAEDPYKYSLSPDMQSAGVAGQSMGGRSYPRTYPMSYQTVFSGTQNSVVTSNLGTGYSQRFLVDITGPLNTGGWRFVNETTDSYISFSVGLSVSDVLTIDFQRGIALLNGYPVTASLSGDFFSLAPGPNTLKLYGDFDPSAGFTLTAYSAWE